MWYRDTNSQAKANSLVPFTRMYAFGKYSRKTSLHGQGIFCRACLLHATKHTHTHKKTPATLQGEKQTQKNTPQGKTHLALLHQILARIKYPAVHDDSVLRVGGPTANPHDSNAHFRTLALAHTHTQKKTCPHPKPTHDIASTFFIRCTPRLKRSLPLCPFFVACFRHCRSCALVSAF